MSVPNAARKPLVTPFATPAPIPGASHVLRIEQGSDAEGLVAALQPGQRYTLAELAALVASKPGLRAMLAPVRPVSDGGVQ
ncbi:hypothetical protein [Streptosporangium sp. NPDC002524]|uniref:hypothetical protein n=1 Tax=Streptosporangium sp. NPDC002524 TaxID=3154537 RepID=UPI003327FE6F